MRREQPPTTNQEMRVRPRFFMCGHCGAKHVAIDFEALENTPCQECGRPLERRISAKRSPLPPATWPGKGDIWGNKRLGIKARIHEIDWQRKVVTITDGRNYQKIPAAHFVRPEEGWKLLKKFTP